MGTSAGNVTASTISLLEVLTGILKYEDALDTAKSNYIFKKVKWLETRDDHGLDLHEWLHRKGQRGWAESVKEVRNQ